MVYRKRVTTTGPKNNKSQSIRSFPLQKDAYFFKKSEICKDCFWFVAHGTTMMMVGDAQAAIHYSLFIFGERVLAEGGGGSDEWNLLPVQRGSDQCHPIVLRWQSGRITVSLPAQWQTRLSWERREALSCHAKSLKPSSFRLGSPTVLCNSLRRWEMTESISAHTRPRELGAA